jgi:RNA polymerase sigma-70 factor (ECF subfamily)
VPYNLAVLYAKHRNAMYKVARKVLRKAGHPDLADDAVHNAIKSIMSRPPERIDNSQAFLVLVAKRKAMDMAKTRAITRRPVFSVAVSSHRFGRLPRIDLPSRNR